eukprot:1160902-Pelagomonas_calceolata.AAC.2
MCTTQRKTPQMPAACRGVLRDKLGTSQACIRRSFNHLTLQQMLQEFRDTINTAAYCHLIIVKWEWQ